MSNSIVILLSSEKTIFSVSDLAILWKIENNNYLKSKIYRLVQSGDLLRLHHGIFSVNMKYDKYELAGRLNNPSYISLETILRENNIIFQYSSEITSISRINKEYTAGGIKYKYHKIKDEVLYNSAGLEMKNNYTIASKERAFLDMIYLNKNYYFDNLDGLDWEGCFKLAEIYKNKSLVGRLKDYYKDYVGQK
ncbi:MAG: hypothetical protein ACD_7C00161G0002 [uncultured bacterium]|nr:MAG: hypothetical protein ACD_7C00161G0002 [uncultured bacterium]HBR79525.1 hypothetical protein [Candidatus Moranbacteria bacterium]